MSELRVLKLQFNNLSGSLPSSFGALSHLEELYLAKNRLTGSIPACLGNIPTLKLLSLRLNGLGGELPLSLIHAKAVRGLDLRLMGNNGFTLPNNLGELGEEVSTLDLNECSLAGPISASLGDLTGLTTIYLFSNALTGTLPDSIAQLHKIRTLNVAMNGLDEQANEGAKESAIAHWQNKLPDCTLALWHQTDLRGACIM
jgi:Leucine-rich repeat (LRR) protein